MSWALARKELREHAVVFLIAAGVSALMLASRLMLDEEGGGRFSALLGFIAFGGVMNAMIAANRLFVREYASRTQLFLEVLPIGRARVFTTKWLLGLGWLVFMNVSAFSITLRQKRAEEVIGWSDAWPVLVATLAFITAVWSFAAMAGMLGRHRYTAWIALITLLAVTLEAGGLATDEIPVLRLLGQHVAMGRIASFRAVLEALGVSVVFTAAAAALALVGSGAMASALSRRMTARERVFMLVSVFAAGFLYQTLKDQRSKPVFVMKDAVYAHSNYAFFGVMTTLSFDKERAQALAHVLRSDVEDLLAALRYPLGAIKEHTFRGVFVLPQEGLDRFVLERAALGARDGIVLRVSPEVPRDLLRMEVLHALIGDTTEQRASKEDRHALLDGFSAYWALRDDAEGRERWWLRAAASRLPISTATLLRWDETGEQLGDCMASSLAFAVVDTLAQQLGEARLIALMAKVFAVPHDDLRVLFETTPRAHLARAGVRWKALAAKAEKARLVVRAARSDELDMRPVLSARIAVVHDKQSGVRVTAALDGEPSYRVLYTELPIWARGAHGFSRFDARAPKVTLPISPRRGTRMFVAIEVQDVLLDCPVRVRAERLRMP
jgi:hypothetical protein